MSDPCGCTPDVSAYLLGALPDAEQRVFATHLVDCEYCQDEVAELEHAAAAMSLAVERRDPPAELKDSLMATVRAEAKLLRAAGADADQPAVSRTRRGWLPRFAAPVAIGLAVAAIAVVGVEALVGGDSNPAVQQTIQANVETTSGTAQIEMLDARTGRLVLDGVPAPPPGHVYVMWIAKPGAAPVAAGTINQVAAGAKTVADIDGDMEGASDFMVTVEPTPGGSAPTAKPVLAAKLS